MIHPLGAKFCSEYSTGKPPLQAARAFRRARLQRFSIDRLMTILNRLDYRVEVTVTMRPMAVEQRG